MIIFDYNFAKKNWQLMKPIDLSKLRVFYVVAREGNMTRAAEKLGVSQPGVSQLISDLEHNLKTKLFDRLSRGARLTPQGERLYSHAKKMMEEHEAFEKVFYEKDDDIEGELKIVTTPYLGSEWLMFKMKEFLQDHPKLKVRIVVREDKDVHIEEGDVAIATSFQHQPHLIQKRLMIFYLKLISSPSYLEKHGIPTKPEDLDSHQLITYGGGGYNPYGCTNWILNLGKSDYEASRESYLEINSLQGLINATLEGHGIAEVPNFPGVLRPGLVEVVFDKQKPKFSFDIHYIFHEKRRNSKKINLLFKCLTKTEKE